MDEGDAATSTVTVTPVTDRNVTVTVTMSGTGATLSGLTYGMLTVARGQRSASFTISGDQDGDAVNADVILTLSTDADGVSIGSPSSTTVTVIDDEEPNIPPVVTTTSPITVQENQTGVATLEASDPDDDPITGWSITGGADSALFDLNNEGVLFFKTAPDYENHERYRQHTTDTLSVEVTATTETDDSDTD